MARCCNDFTRAELLRRAAAEAGRGLPAIEFWGSPTLRPATRAALLTFANRAMGDANAKWKQTSYRFLTANALRQLIAVSPDLQTS